MGYSRQQFYEIMRNFETYGAEGPIDRLPGARGPHPNRVPAEIEQAVLDHALAYPCHGSTRIEQELRLKGVQVSSGGVRGVWQRHNLLTKQERLLRLEKSTAERQIDLSQKQVAALERFSPEFRERYIEAPHTGALVAIDTFFVGVLKGVGKIYLQSAIDCHSRYAFARLYPNKLPVTAVHLMNNDMLPFFEEKKAQLDVVLTDNGREFCGRPDQHPTNSSCNWKRSSIARPKYAGRNRTASSNACTAYCSTSTSASKAAAHGSKALRKCRYRSINISKVTTIVGPIRGAA